MSLEPEDFELELPHTWPAQVRGLLEEGRETLIAYQRERERIDVLGRTDVWARMDPPVNPYRTDYDAVVACAETLLHGHRMVGYHCTRLTASEVGQIHREGLRALSADLVRDRFQALVGSGEMTAERCRFFLDHPMLRARLFDCHGARAGLVWLCPNRSTLCDASGVHRFFRAWGGEAVYAGFEDDPSVFAELRAIGMPAIVKCAVPLPVDKTYGCRAAHLLSNAVRDKIEYPEPSPAFDWSVQRDITPSEVLDVITLDDPRFDELTGYRRWEPQYRLG